MSAPKPFTKLCGLALAGAGLLGLAVAPALAGDGSQQDKALRVEDEPNSKPLEVTLEPSRARYHVGEPVRLKVRGNQTFYLYLIGEDLDTGEQTLLLPNRKQSDNRYPGGTTFTVPNRNVVITADTAGRERITMVASERYIDVDTSRFNKSGDFFKAKGGVIESAFTSKGLRIRDERSDGDSSDDVVIRDVEIRVLSRGGLLDDILRGESEEAPGSSRVITVLSTDKDRYEVGDRLHIAYGASQPGMVSLYVIEPDGSYSKLTSRKVEADKLSAVDAIAESTGLHTLIAVHSGKDEASRREIIDRILKGGEELRLAEDGSEPVSHAVKEFRVVY